MLITYRLINSPVSTVNSHMWKIFKSGTKNVEMSKSGDIYYTVIKDQGEVIMTIVQPPASYDGKTSIGGKVSVFNAEGNFQGDRSRDIKYGDPIILFNPKNRAGLQLVDAKSEAASLLPEALEKNPDAKVDLSKLATAEAISVREKERIAMGSSSVQINSDNTVSIINTPQLNAADQEFLKSMWRFTVIGLLGTTQTYRANVMLLDPIDNMLKITAQYNMDGYIDKNISLQADTGGAGKGLQNDSVERVDLVMQRHSDFKIDPNKVWRDMKTIFCVPIHDSDGNRLGVLCIDSDNQISKTRLYDDRSFEYAMGLDAEAIGKFLEQKL